MEAVNLTPMYTPYAQTVENNMSAVNQSTNSNVSIPQSNSPFLSTEVTLNTLALLYNNDQLADPDLWDGLFTPTSLLGVDQFLSYDTQNITCSLVYIGTFIKQCLLDNKLIKGLSDLVEVSIAT